jgi:hypothetical protein
MSDSYDDYEAKMALAEHEWEMVKTEHDRAVELGKAYERGWNAALAQQEPVAWRYALDASVEGPRWIYIDKDPHQWLKGPSLGHALIESLYTSPPKAAEWVGLTDDDVSYFRYQATFCDEFDAAFMAELIEKDLKEKNHG